MRHIASYLTRDEISQSFSKTDWQSKCFKEFDMVMRSKSRPFPCLRGVMGYQENHLRFAFFDEISISPLATILSSYLKNSHDFGQYTSLVIFERPGNLHSLDVYHEKFWRHLKDLSAKDKKSWPTAIPNKVDHHGWEFCFDNQPMFVVCNTPAHIYRRSRYAPSFMMTFQPRWVFDDLLGTKEQAEKEFKIVSERLLSYDHIEKSPLLGHYGALDNREADQYFLDDENKKMGCPYSHLRGEETS